MLKPNIDPRLLNSSDTFAIFRPEEYPDLDLETLQREFESFEKIDRDKREHWQACLELYPEYLLNSCDEEDWRLFTLMNRYDSKHRVFVAGCYEGALEEQNLCSYKHRRIGNIKWKTRAGTHPNSVLAYRIRNQSSPIYFVEGVRDCSAAILLGLDVVMIPTASFRLKSPDQLPGRIEKRKVIFIVEDKQAFKCMSSIARKIERSAGSVLLRQLQQGTKMDLTDYLFINTDIEEVYNEFNNYKPN